jgi:competence protein ComEC
LLAAAWIAGVLAGNGAALSARVWAVAAVVAVLTALALGTAVWQSRGRKGLRAAVLALALTALAAAGAARARQVSSPPPGDVSEWIGRQVGITGTIVRQPAADARRQRFLLEAESVRSAGMRHAVSGRVYVFATASPAVALGDRVELFGVPERPLPATNPGGFSAAAWLRGEGCFALLRLRPKALRHCGRGNLPGPRGFFVAARRAIAAPTRRALERTIERRGNRSSEERALISMIEAVAWGSPDAPEPDHPALAQRFRDANLIHVLVASGAQVALLLWFLLFSRLWLGVRGSAILALAGIWLYAGIAGGEPPILRATVMGTLYLAGLIVAREAVIENSLGLAAFGILLVEPPALLNVGFHLSFIAVWGLIRLGRPLELALQPLLPGWGGIGKDRHGIVRALQRFQSDPLTLFSAAVAAPAFCAGIMALAFQRLYLVSLGANFVGVPLAAAILLLSLPLALWNLAWERLGLGQPGVLNLGNEVVLLIAAWLDGVAAYFATRSWGLVRVFPPAWPAVLLGVAGLILLGNGIHAWTRSRSVTESEEDPGSRRGGGHRRHRRVIALVAAPLLCLPMVVGMFLPGRPPAAPELTFLDVGQGDCCLARFPDGGTMLVDGGGSPFSEFDVGERVVAPALRAMRVGRIDLVVLTHAHEDHVGGLPAILREFRVGRVLDAAGPVDARSYEAFRDAARAQGVPITVARRGMRIALGPRRATLLEVLHPAEPLLVGTNSDPNNNSVVLRVTSGSTRFLLTGDAEAGAEGALRGLDLRADVLKVGHHGSRTSTDDALLDAVRPRLAIVSCGRRNSFGHPAAATLSRLERRGVAVFRTDRDGAVVVTGDGRRLVARGTLPAPR